MSKKYMLVVKEEYSGYIRFSKPINDLNFVNSNINTYRKINETVIISAKPSLLTQEDINELPYGFVNMFNIVEVDETTYYWRKKKEYLRSFEDVNYCYLNIWLFSDTLVLKNTVETSGYKTKFTEKEAKELLGDEFEMFERVDIEWKNQNTVER